MDKIKLIIEKCLYVSIIAFIVINALFKGDNFVAVISAICGITYTTLAGKGYPICYLFGVTGSGFYGFLSFQNSLWGNLLLYVGYYIPMQILGYLKWNQNLKSDKKEVIKTYATKTEIIVVTGTSLILTAVSYFILLHFQDKHPILDSVTTILSLAGMYFTVRRCIEQWLMWTVVNLLSFIMWLNLALNGAKCWSTVIMWAVYLFLSFYFYFDWKKELNNYSQM